MIKLKAKPWVYDLIGRWFQAFPEMKETMEKAMKKTWFYKERSYYYYLKFDCGCVVGSLCKRGLWLKWNTDNPMWKCFKENLFLHLAKMLRGSVTVSYKGILGREWGNRLRLKQNIIFTIFMLGLIKKCLASVEIGFGIGWKSWL